MAYYKEHGKPPSWNVINASRENNIKTFEEQSDNIVARTVTKKLYYQRGSQIPVTSFEELKEEYYLGRGVDRCSWQSKDCVFKRIEFDCDIQMIDREIKSREQTIGTLKSENCPNIKGVMEDRFRTIPVLAVVVAQGTEDDVIGILMPFGGLSLESLAEISPEALQKITVQHLKELIRGVSELDKIGLLHEDINDRNTLLQPYELDSTPDYNNESQRLILVDFGSPAPEYQGDAHALGDLFFWCLGRSSWSDPEQALVKRAAQVLQRTGSFDEVLGVLNTGVS